MFQFFCGLHKDYQKFYISYESFEFWIWNLKQQVSANYFFIVQEV